LVGKLSAQKWYVLYEGADDSVLHKTSDLEVVRRKDSIEWTIIDDPTVVNPPTEYDEVGLIGFDWNMFSDENIHVNSCRQYNFPFLTLLKHLWPGDYNTQIQNMNKFITKENKRRQEAGNRSQSSCAKKKSNFCLAKKSSGDSLVF